MAPPVKLEDRVAALETQLAELKASHDRTIKLGGWVKYQLIALLKKFGMYESRDGPDAPREPRKAEVKQPQANGQGPAKEVKK